MPMLRLLQLGLVLFACTPGHQGAHAETASAKEKPFQAYREMAAKEALAGVTQAQDGASGEQTQTKVSMAGVLEPVGSPGKLAFFQQVKKNGGIDALELFDTVVKSKAFGKILDNVEIQHRLLGEIPMLSAIPGFMDVAGRRLSDEETTAGFGKGLRNLLAIMKTAKDHAKDPTLMNIGLIELSKSTDPEIQALFHGAKENDQASVMELQNIVAKDFYPGVDVDRMRDILGELSFEKILSFPKMSRFVDQDSYLSKVFRS